MLVSVVFFVACTKAPQVNVEHLVGQTMGTSYNVKYPALSDVDSGALKAAIDQRLVRVNALMSTYDPTSELSRFNQYRYSTPFELSAETMLVIHEAMRLGELSDGVLDVTVGPLVNLWGFGPTMRPETIPSDEDITAVRQYVGLDKLEVRGNTLIKKHPQLYVDLSTIAKGYGVDVVADLLEQQGITDYLVEIGGEMRVKGNKADGSPWLIAIEKPVSDERAVQKVVSIGDNAIATSGDYRNYYEQDGIRYSHLIDPTTGKPIQHNTVSVTVVASSSMSADGLATAFNVMGWDSAIALAEEHDIAVFIIRRVDDTFEEYSSPAFDELVTVY
ncbi:FAD:protein FMN transferase [Alteromonas sp. chi3]|uniref:FAD:protein FMN transferase n=1 Tax=Alteromonas gilva TaxID=2987522 RepID=A0ABT5L5D8_9ALTE|nr:FAD:protein FMN transferase [Alteromonas gilva]MDC8832261.1 FAD:protein FMN transferase [Alteromonas gilva]